MDSFIGPRENLTISFTGAVQNSCHFHQVNVVPQIIKKCPRNVLYCDHRFRYYGSCRVIRFRTKNYQAEWVTQCVLYNINILSVIYEYNIKIATIPRKKIYQTYRYYRYISDNIFYLLATSCEFLYSTFVQ